MLGSCSWHKKSPYLGIEGFGSVEMDKKPRIWLLDPKDLRRDLALARLPTRLPHLLPSPPDAFELGASKLGTYLCEEGLESGLSETGFVPHPTIPISKPCLISIYSFSASDGLRLVR